MKQLDFCVIHFRRGLSVGSIQNSFKRRSFKITLVEVEKCFYGVYSEQKLIIAANIYFSLCISHCARDFT